MTGLGTQGIGSKSGTFRDVNAAIRREFKMREGFLPATSWYVGSIPAVSFKGDMPVSLVCDIAAYVERNFPQFVRPFDKPTHRWIGYNYGKVTINWA